MDWTLRYDGFDPAKEGVREALCTLGNGYIATRGAAEEAEADDVHYTGTYLAGGYNRLKTEIAGRVVENEDLVNFPNWLSLRFRPEGGDWFSLTASEIISYRQELDLRRGVLKRAVRFRDQHGRETAVASRRIVHMRYQHLAAIEVTITPANWTGRIEVISALDGSVTNSGVDRYRGLNDKHLSVLDEGAAGEEGIRLLVETVQSQIRMAQAVRTRVFKEDKPLRVERRLATEPELIAHHFAVDAEQGIPITIEKLAAIYTSKDRAISEPDLSARDAIQRSARFDELLESHIRTWKEQWRRFDVELAERPAEQTRAQMILRLHIFQLLQTVSTNTRDLDVGVPARGLHGEAYRGHIFWDELFIFPLLNLRIPELTRALLRYRYRRLDKARELAAQAGFQGACFPWQSGSDGREETQRLHLNPKSGRWLPDNSHLQRHVNAAIAHNIWGYLQATNDEEFLLSYGAEMMLEIARFFAGLATWSEEHERYEIRGVMGPDEYHDWYPGADHPGFDNNAYTNVMAVWVLVTAFKLLAVLDDVRRAELTEAIELGPDELQRWSDVSAKMRVCFHDGDIISQFEGYEALAEFDWDGYRAKYGDIQRLDRILEAEGDTPNRYKVAKQADVLMLFYLFSAEELLALFRHMGYSFDRAAIRKNVEYYLKRTSHGSTLSNIVHSWVLARSNRRASWRLFEEALASDIADIQGGTTHEGIHLGAMAGTVDLAQRGYGGIEVRDDMVWFNPCLPHNLRRLRFNIIYRRHVLRVDMDHHRLTVTEVSVPAVPVKIGFAGKVYELCQGESREFRTRH